MTGLKGLAGRRILVTGAANGIGRATVLRFAHEGCRVALVDLETEHCEAVAAEAAAAGAEAIALTADVRNEGSLASAVADAEGRFGGLDVIVANAAIEPRDDDRTDRLDLDVWKRVVDTNLTGTFITCKHGLRSLLRSDGQNRSVAITVSPTGIRGIAPGEDAYSSSKAGAFGLMRVLAAGFAPDGIRVNGVMPGFTDTRVNRYLFDDQALLDDLLRSIPMRRPGMPEEVAAMMAWLASDDASYATGAVFAVDGGMTAI